VPTGNRGIPLGVSSRCTFSTDALFTRQLDNLHKGGLRSASLDVRSWDDLPRSKDDKDGQKPRCWMLLH
jgi:hypothetical protein